MVENRVGYTKKKSKTAKIKYSKIKIFKNLRFKNVVLIVFLEKSKNR